MFWDSRPRNEETMTLSIIIPAFNEEKTLGEIIKRVKDVKLPKGINKQIIIVNDGSSDRTSLIAKKFKSVELLEHQKNLGKGHAIRTGIKKAKGEIVLIQDSDLEYSPSDYPNLLKPLIEENYDVVFGSRELNRKNNKHSYLSFYLGGLLVTKTANLLYGTNLSDVPTGYKVFRSSLLRDLKLDCGKFEFCPEVTAKIARKNIPIKEVPIKYFPRTKEQGKKIRWTDGIEAIWTLFKYRL